MSNSTTSNAVTASSSSDIPAKGLHCLILGCGGIAMGIALQLLSREDKPEVIEKLVFVVRDDSKGQEAVSDLISLLKKQSSKNNAQASNNTPSSTPTITSKKSGMKSEKENNYKQRIEYVVADLSLMKSSVDGVKRYMSKYAACDIVISAAGEGIQTGITSTTIEKENKIFASNLLGHVIFTSYLLPMLKNSSLASTNSNINRGTILFTVGEQKNYKDLPDVKNLRFESIQRMQSSAAASVTSNTDGSSAEDLQRTPTKTNSMSAASKLDKTKRKSQGKLQSENKQQQQLPSPYSAAKVGMFCMAMEIARKNPELHIGLINPGIVRTNFHKDCGENIPDEFFTSTPEDVGELVDWILSSPESFTKQSNGKDASTSNVAKMFKVKTKCEVPIADSPSSMRFGENILDEKAQANIYEAILQHLGINEKDALLNEKTNTLSSPSSRSVKSGSSGSSSRGKSLIASKCNIM